MIRVHRVWIPPMSTIGYGYGKDENGKNVSFVGDHRPMRDLGEAIVTARSSDELPMVEPEDWQMT